MIVPHQMLCPIIHVLGYTGSIEGVEINFCSKIKMAATAVA